jgi:hypothetical protein
MRPARERERKEKGERRKEKGERRKEKGILNGMRPARERERKEKGERRKEKGESKIEAEVNLTKEVKPEKTTAFSSLLEQINAKRNDKYVVGSTPIIENPTLTVEVEHVETKKLEVPKDKPEVLNLLKDINSRRLEYGTPNIASVGLPRPELSPINLNPASSSVLPEVDNTGIDESDDSPQDNIPGVN